MLFLSASDGLSQAVTRHAWTESFEETWAIVLHSLKEALVAQGMSPTLFRADWVVHREQIAWKVAVNARRGSIALSKDMAFLDWELAANGILYTQSGLSRAQANAYAQKRFHANFPELADDSLVFLVKTQGVFIDAREGAKKIEPVRDTWNAFRSCEGPRDALLTDMRAQILPRLSILTKQSRSSLFLTLGIFAFSAAGMQSELEAALKQCRIEYRSYPDGQAAFLADGQELKIGASGILLAALCLGQVTGTLPESLALGITHMYPNHVYDAKTYTVRDTFRIAAYDFEAAYGLLLYAKRSGQNAAYELGKKLLYAGLKRENGAESFWAALCLAELVEKEPENMSFRQSALRCLPRPYQVLDKKEANPKDCLRLGALLRTFRTFDVGTRLDVNAYAAAFECLTARLASAVLWPEVALFFPKPNDRLFGFAIRENKFRMRLDDEQESLCALLAYADYCKAGSLLHEKKRTCSSPALCSIDVCKQILSLRRTELFFLWLDIPLVASGLELAAMRRAELFATFFGSSVCILINRYQANAQQLAAMHCRLGHLSNQRVLSMYDFFQEIDRNLPPRDVAIPPADPSWVKTAVSNSKDFRYWENKFCVQYVGFDRMTGRLSYIGHYDHTVKVRHDSFDELGFLGRSEILDPQSGLTTDAIYYRPDGSIALLEKYAIEKQGNRYSSRLVRMDWVYRNGFLRKRFLSHDAAVTFWMRTLINPEKTYIAIGDRKNAYDDAVEHLRGTHIAFVHVLHSNHTDVDFDPIRSPLKSAYAWLYNRKIAPDVAITMTEAQKNDILRRFDHIQVVAIPHAAQASPEVSTGYSPFKVSMVGRIMDGKGHGDLLQAFVLVVREEPRAELHLYGYGDRIEYFRREAQLLGISEQVFFEGFLDDVRIAYTSSAVTVLTSSQEGFALVVEESMALGCPVISYDTPYGPSDMIDDGQTGFLVQKGDITGLSDRILLLLKNPDLRNQMARAARQTICERFSEKSVTTRWASLFCLLLSRMPQN